MKKRSILRRVVQALFLCLFIYILWSTTYPLTGIIAPEAVFTADPLVMLVTSVSERLILPGIGIALVMLAAAALAGRFFCGWMCPLGAAIDLVPCFDRKGPRPDPHNVRAAAPKYFILAFIGVAALLGVQTAWILDPLVIAARFVSLNLIPVSTAALDKVFETSIRLSGFSPPVYDLYRSLQGSVLGVEVRYFAHSLFIFSLFAAVIAWALYVRRGWCRSACPLGALYALEARFALLKRRVIVCSGCGNCRRICPTQAIRKDFSYSPSECILCMDCVYGCPESTRFGFSSPLKTGNGEGGITRRQFLSLAFVSAVPPALDTVTRHGRRQTVIRPPAALEEREFVNRCIRCGNCMKVCITNGLQPDLLQSGLAGIWTPRLVPEIGYCEYHCTLCGSVCPTGAIPRLSQAEKKKVRIGLARIDRKRCLPFKDNKQCIVCEEHCPIPKKAIKLKKVDVDGKILLRPYIDPRLCNGCGICQTRCPVKPVRAIRVYPVRVTHGLPSHQGVIR